MRSKFWMMGILSVLTICFITVGAAAAQPPTQAQQDRLDAVFVNGTELKAYLEGHPSMGYVYIDDNTRTMVPLRAIGDLLGLQTQFRSADQAIVIDGGAKGQVVFHLNSTAYSVGWARCTMDTAPVYINGRTHVPIRFLVESLGGLVYYTPKSGYRNGVAEIYYHANDVTPHCPLLGRRGLCDLHPHQRLYPRALGRPLAAAGAGRPGRGCLQGRDRLLQAIPLSRVRHAHL